MLDLSNIGAVAAQTVTASAFIRETDTQRFETDVIQASMQTPVIVDFWAPWCGPCKQMMPVIEKVVTEAAGAVHLVKVNIDANPELAQVFRVQSVPMVYAFFKGQPVDGFVGARLESELRAFVDKLKKLSGVVPSPEAVDVSKTMALADQYFRDEKYTDALVEYSNVLDQAPDNMDAMAGIGWCFVAQRNAEALPEFIASLDDTQKKHPRIAGLSFIAAQMDNGGGDAEDLSAKLLKNPADHQSRFDLARVKMAALDIESAIEALVELIRRDREWQEQKARQYLLQILDALGAPHPLAAWGRRRLSAVLFS
jgi:putative thioredoxin